MTIRNYLSDLRQFIAWCEADWCLERDEHPFTPQAISPPLLLRYRAYLQTTLWLKPSTVNRTLMSLKRYFAWVVKIHLIQHDPTSAVKFVPKEATAPRHLDDDEEGALVAAVNATGTLRDRTIITLLLHTGLRAQEVCTLTRKQVRLSKRSGTLRIIGKRRKVRDVPLNATARSILGTYLEILPEESMCLFPSGKTRGAITQRALGHLIAKYARLAHLVDVSPHDLRHRFGYRMAEVVPLHRLAQIMGHDSLDTTMLYIRGTKQDLQHDVEKQTYIITFKGVSGEIASRYESELRNALLNATPDIEVDQRRADSRTQDFGSTLVLILGTPAVLAVAKAMGDWLKMRQSASIDIEKDGHIHAENLTSKDALRLAELFQPKK